MSKFEFAPVRYEKEIELCTPDELDCHVRILVDYDDVNHDVVRAVMTLLCEKLNELTPEQLKAAVEAGLKQNAADAD